MGQPEKVSNQLRSVFKAALPRCSIARVSLLNALDIETHDGVGLFARAFMEYFPGIPAEEGRLHDPQAGKNFLERVRAYRRTR